jgi:hypothetical protein
MVIQVALVEGARARLSTRMDLLFIYTAFRASYFTSSYLAI